MRIMITRIGDWFDRRLQLAAPVREIAEHPVPRNTASWWYVFGSAALTVFVLQIVTGILLALIYVPSGAEAWSSLQALNHSVTLGWFIRAMHGWGSNFMVAIVLIHMVQVFLFGAHKFPRELTWIVGVFLLLMTLGMAFTGQVLRFDQDAYWGLGIGASIASRVPVLGPAIVKLMLGGPIIAGATLSVRLGQPASPIPRSSKLFPNRITFSCGCMLCSRCSRPRSKHRHF
jgi:ubiquinol-cytochrome c reductase cytochrome b subunit